MNTFLPYPSYYDSANCLDDKRLGKQRVEVKQIYLSLTLESYGWKHHPAVKMWQGHRGDLLLYGMACCNVWLSRGFKDSLLGEFGECFEVVPVEECCPPSWLGDDRLHLSHQSNLLRKNPTFYSFFDVPSDLPYFWPILGNA